MIALIQNLNNPDIYGNTWKDYDAMILDCDRESRSVRGWDYGAIYHYGDFTGNDVVLDIGGATSYFFIYLAKFVKETWCVDSIFSNGWATQWLKTLCHYEEYLKGKARIHIQNASRLPFPDGSIDKVVTCSAMEHFDDDDDTFCAKEIYRVLKPGGIFLGTLDYNWFNEKSPEKYGEARVYTYESFKRRILNPSGLRIDGMDYLKNQSFEEFLEYKYLIQPLFFKLRKV